MWVANSRDVKDPWFLVTIIFMIKLAFREDLLKEEETCKFLIPRYDKSEGKNWGEAFALWKSFYQITVKKT